ncbi:MAG: stage III sporulation protein AF [Clostridium sp.]
MEALKTFIITLVTTLIFMTAVELVVPDNAFKKYVKFVLGLILIAVIINPIITFLSEGEGNLTKMIDEFSTSKETTQNNSDGDKEKNDIQEKAFKDSFNKSIISNLEKKFPKTEFEVDVDSKVDLKNITVDIKSVAVQMSDDTIKKVDKIQIGDKNEKIELTKKEKEVRAYLSLELAIEENKITINNKK